MYLFLKSIDKSCVTYSVACLIKIAQLFHSFTVSLLFHNVANNLQFHNKSQFHQECAIAQLFHGITDVISGQLDCREAQKLSWIVD